MNVSSGLVKGPQGCIYINVSVSLMACELISVHKCYLQELHKYRIETVTLLSSGP